MNFTLLINITTKYSLDKNKSIFLIFPINSS